MFKIIKVLELEDNFNFNTERKYFILCTECNKEIVVHQKNMKFFIEKDIDDIHSIAALEWIRELSLSKSQFRRYKILKKYGDLE